MLRWMLGNLLVWAVLFFGVPYAGVRFVPPEAGMMFTMALWLAVYPLYIALASHSAAQRKWNTLWLPLVHPALYALGVWLVFHTVPEFAYCAGYLAVGYGFWGAGWGMKRRRQRRDFQCVHAPKARIGNAGRQRVNQIEQRPFLLVDIPIEHAPAPHHPPDRQQAVCVVPEVDRVQRRTLGGEQQHQRGQRRAGRQRKPSLLFHASSSS